MLGQLAEIAAKRADVSAQRGPAGVKQLMGLRQSGFENLVTQRGLGIKQAELQADIDQAARDDALQARGQDITARGQSISARTQRRQQNITRRGQDVSAAERQADRRSREQIARERLAEQGRPAKKNEPAQSVKFRQNIASGRGEWRRLMRKFKNDEARVKRVMIERNGVPPEAYNAIYDLERNGSLHPSNARALRALGVRVPPQWRRRNTRRSAQAGTGTAPGTRRGQSRPG